MRHIQNEKGIALITMLLMLVVLTVIGLNAISITSLENKTGANERIYESSKNCQEAGVDPQLRVLEQTILDGAVPATYLSTNNNGPVAATANLQNEILAQVKEVDSAGGTGASGADLSITCGTSTVNMDIDYLFTRPNVGNSLEFASASAGTGGGAGSGGVETYYQFVSEAAVQNGKGSITNVYDCVVSNGCQK